MQAERYDTVWERGAAWERRLRRRRADGTRLPFTAPASMTLHSIDGEARTLALDVVGTFSEDDLTVTLRVESEQTGTLAPGIYEHAIWAGDHMQGRQCFARGYVTVRDRVGL